MFKRSFLLLAFLLSIQATGAAPLVTLSGVTSPDKPVSASDPIPVSGTVTANQTSVAQASIINTTDNIPNTSTTVTLAQACTHVLVKTPSTAAILYIDFANGAAATSADFQLDPGAGILIEGPSITTFKILGASATGTYSVLAW